MFKTLLTWWNSATIGTLINTSLNGREVGRDEQDNVYYEQKKDPRPGQKRRRWVIYNGTVEASRVPSDWHGWLHHIFDEPPSQTPLKRQSWEKDHKPNMTGTREAYFPSGSLWRGAQTPAATGDYEAWQPDSNEVGNGTR